MHLPARFLKHADAVNTHISVGPRGEPVYAERGLKQHGQGIFIRGGQSMEYVSSTGPCCNCHSRFPADLATVSNQELERLHVAACREVDFEYFLEGGCRPCTRSRYTQIDEEVSLRAVVEPVTTPVTT